LDEKDFNFSFVRKKTNRAIFKGAVSPLCAQRVEDPDKPLVFTVLDLVVGRRAFAKNPCFWNDAII
jgi:hypothetical protein